MKRNEEAPKRKHGPKVGIYDKVTDKRRINTLYLLRNTAWRYPGSFTWDSEAPRAAETTDRSMMAVSESTLVLENTRPRIYTWTRHDSLSTPRMDGQG